MALTTVPVELANLDGAVTVNESSADADFRVESNGSANMLFVDGGNDEVVVQRASSGATATAGSVLIIEDDDNAELSILGGSSSVLAINFGHSGDNDEGKITFNTTAGSEDLQIVSSKAITLDATGDITIDADDGDIYLKDGGTTFGQLAQSSGDFHILQPTADKDILLRGLDDSSYIVALQLDMSEGGAATFNAEVIAPNGSTEGYHLKQTGGTATPRVTNDGNEWTIIRPGASGADVAINNYANSHNRVIFRDEGNVEIGDGNLVFASGHGIDFGATANAPGLAGLGTETLDDYEDGTWTPALISGGSTNPTGGGALSPSGRYTKIGNRVWVTFYVGRSYTNSPNGGIMISGLPYTINASTNGYYTPCVTYNVTYGDNGVPFLIPSGGNTTLSLYATSSGGTWPQLTWQDHASSSGTYVTGTISYHA